MTHKNAKKVDAARQARLRYIAAVSMSVAVVMTFAFVGTYRYGASQAARQNGTSEVITVNTMGFSPSTGKVIAGAVIPVTLYANSGAQAVNTIQAKVVYDSSRLQLQSLEETGVFNQIAATDTATPGVVQIARAATGTPLSGTMPVIKLNFVAKQTVTGSAVLSVDSSASYVVSASTGANILAGTTTATFTIRR
ncbi:MAG TPA: cohesin domain-containing protein [Hymenobacter sp.]|jgi:hypothetical protein